MAKNERLVFERMVEDMCALEQDSRLLDECMDLSEEAIRRVPMRCRIIALGFVKGFTLEELNEKLVQQGCPKLYIRNFWEATLVYAFRNGLGYDAWKALHTQCGAIYEEMEKPDWFAGKRITYGELERYVRENSDTAGDERMTRYITKGIRGELMTQRVTQLVSSRMLSVQDEAGLIDFLVQNAEMFSPMREKARYYLCKYLYYYLNRRIESYFAACEKKQGVDEALSDLLALKVVTKLRRHQRMEEADKRREIAASPISCGELFDEFSYFYFDYVSCDWVEILMECYGAVEEIPAAEKKRVADVLRKGRPALRLLSDAAVIRKRMAEMEAEEDEAPVKSRAGELALYKYIQGTLDIDRTTLICFLLFLASDAIMPEAHKLTVERLQDILISCGYTPLDTEDDFDWFVVEFLESRHPKDFLMEVMLDYAKRSENSFLYRLYGRSVSYGDELVRVMIKKQ